MNEEILGGLKSALERGESLKKAMMSFYNAGYKKEDIEEAARFLNENPVAQPQISQPVSETKPKKSLFGGMFQKKEKQEKPESSPIQKPIPSPAVPPVVSNYAEKPVQPKPMKEVQKVSNYGIEKQTSDKALIIILVGG